MVNEPLASTPTPPKVKVSWLVLGVITCAIWVLFFGGMTFLTSTSPIVIHQTATVSSRLLPSAIVPSQQLQQPTVLSIATAQAVSNPNVVPTTQINSAYQTAVAVMQATPLASIEEGAKLNDPYLNGGNIAPAGCTFPILEGVCANGVLVKDVPDAYDSRDVQRQQQYIEEHQRP